MRHFKIASGLLAVVLAFSCQEQTKEQQGTNKQEIEFNYKVTEFADIGVLRYQIPGWEELNLQQQKLVYYLTQAGLSGRDITWDQNYRHNLAVRKGLEEIYTNYEGDKSTVEWKQFETYLNRLWFANGIHHHYSMDKMKPEFSKEYLTAISTDAGVQIPMEAVEVLFNDVDAKKVVLDKDKDIVLESAVNFYEPGITTAEAQEFYKTRVADKEKPVEIGLNSRLVRRNGQLMDDVYKSGGLYGEAIDQIIYWLQLAQGVAETTQQAKA
ncbi:MAG: dipeptidyl-peptidase-3, partial [Nonlabens sp.]